MARQLVEAMTGEFDAEKYHDEYREALMGVIESKVAGVEPAAAAPSDDSGKLIDLMAALEASVKAATDARAADAPVSVAEARADRASGKTAARKSTRTAAKPAANDEAEAKPARKRKSA
jgi:DNA end-binding protein Ku